jgi:hypothetical protein
LPEEFLEIDYEERVADARTARREADSTEITYDVGFQIFLDKYADSPNQGLKEIVEGKIEELTNKIWKEQGFERKFGEISVAHDERSDEAFREWSNTGTAVRAVARNQILQEQFDAKFKISPENREGWAEYRKEFEYQIQQLTGDYGLKISNLSIARAFNGFSREEGKILDAQELLNGNLAELDTPGDAYITKGEAGRLAGALMDKYVDQAYLDETGMTREEIKADFQEKLDANFVDEYLEVKNDIPFVRAGAISRQLGDWLFLDDDKRAGVEITDEIMVDAGIDTGRPTDDIRTEREQQILPPVEIPEEEQELGGLAGGYILPEDKPVEEKGFFEKIMSAFQEGGVWAAITTLISSIFGGGSEEEEKRINLAGMDKDGNKIVSVGELAKASDQDLDVNKDGKLNNKDMVALNEALKDDAQMQEVLSTMKHRFDDKAMVPGTGGATPQHLAQRQGAEQDGRSA